MSRGTEITRKGLRRAGEEARGLNRQETRTIASRQAELFIGNRLMLPVRIVPAGQSGQAGSSTAAAPLQSPAGALSFLSGYSAVAGTPEATADATGRAGDTLRVAVGPASGGSNATAALQVLYPLTATASGGSTATATLTVV